MDLIVICLKNGDQPDEKIESRILQLKPARYALYDNKLYRKGYSMPLLKCIPAIKAEYIMREIHDGIYGNHTRGQSLAFQTLRKGYYWSTMKADCMEFSPSVTNANGSHL